LVEKEGEMALGRRRYPFEMPLSFFLNHILSIIAGHLSKKALLQSPRLLIVDLKSFMFLLEAEYEIILFPRANYASSGQQSEPCRDFTEKVTRPDDQNRVPVQFSGKTRFSSGAGRVAHKMFREFV
jgi:hypothetical protein